ncbi:MAG: hypothetical protein J6J60_07005 [Clostridia bacterium]|nr:hypothetical protein [Clostridia bacterium]
MRANKDYEKRVHKILKTYNSILVKCKNIPLLSDKNIIMIENINSMVNAQIETRKPILYFQEEKSISFMLLDGKESYIYVLKANDGTVSQVEQVINDFKYARNTFVKEILSKIETVLLSGSIEKEKVLTSNEIKYLESIKKNSNVENGSNLTNNNFNNMNESNTKQSDFKNILQNNLEMQDVTKDIENNNNEITKSNEEDNNSKNLYLVPIKKRVNFFNKNKKAKKSNSKKNGRRRKIV